MNVLGKRTTARLHLPPGGRGTTITVDGVALENVITDLSIDAARGMLPVLTLSLHLAGIDVDGTFEVRLDERTHAALIALGWRPPADQPPAR